MMTEKIIMLHTVERGGIINTKPDYYLSLTDKPSTVILITILVTSSFNTKKCNY